METGEFLEACRLAGLAMSQRRRECLQKFRWWGTASESVPWPPLSSHGMHNPPLRHRHTCMHTHPLYKLRIYILYTHTQMSTSSVNSWHFTAKHSVSFCLACGVPPFLYYLYNALYLATEARESLDRFWPLLSLHKFFFFHTMLCTFIFFL